MASIQITRELHDKQIAYVVAKQRYVLTSGGWGSGKTEALCYKLISRASIKGAREILTRKWNVSLGKSTLKSLIEGNGINDPILPPGTYTHYKQSQVIKIKGGGEIIYFGLDDPQKTGSINATGAGMDELVEFNERDFQWVNARCRVVVPGLSNQVYGACNPSIPTHWAAKHWGLALGAVADPEAWHIRMNGSDNPWLPASSKATQDRLTGIARRRFRDGMWAGADGLVYDNYDPEVHIVRFTPERWVRAVIGVDQGFTNPFGVLLCLLDSDGRMHLETEEYKTGLVPEEKLERIRRVMAGSPVKVEAVVVDPSAAELIEFFKRSGLNAVPADNDLGHIDTVRQRFERAADGKPRLTIDPSCSNLQRELGCYQWAVVKVGEEKRKDVPKKEDDHLPDALRYAVAHIDRGTPLVVSDSPPLVVSGNYDPEERYWS